jgi:uncharacterized protein
MPLAPFHPHPLLRGGHVQTLAAYWFHGESLPEQATRHEVTLDDGDRIVLHDDAPADWSTGEGVVLLIHGLAGCHASPYMQRIARKLRARGLRTFRLDLRGCGAGLALARFPYHCGRSEDARAALRSIATLCPGSPVALIGFSLGGNIALKLLGEEPARLPDNLERVAAVCPPIELKTCVEAFQKGINRLYDRYFARLLRDQVAARKRLLPATVIPDGWPDPLDPGKRNSTPRFRAPRGVYDFDDRFTAPVAGFGTANNYYDRCSAAQFLPAIRRPCLILAAADDPLIPKRIFDRLPPNPSVILCLTAHVGHLGYLGRASADADRRWLDWRIVEWCESGRV